METYIVAILRMVIEMDLGVVNLRMVIIIKEIGLKMLFKVMEYMFCNLKV
jgi:hypothetical protein